MACSKLHFSSYGRARNAADVYTKQYNIPQRPYKCVICKYWHLTTQQPYRKVNRNFKRGSKGYRISKQIRERRRVYRKNILPIESWENEGGAVLD